jgi:nucleoside triphosphatase
MAEQHYPEPTVGALIFDPQGRLLLVRSHKWRGRYVVPGGHVELGERLVEALVREAREETGLDVYDLEFLCFQEFIYDDDFWKRRHFIFFDFSCRTDSTAVQLNSEAEEYLWASPEDALNLPLEPYTVNAVREYLRRHGAG